MPKALGAAIKKSLFGFMAITIALGTSAASGAQQQAVGQSASAVSIGSASSDSVIEFLRLHPELESAAKQMLASEDGSSQVVVPEMSDQTLYTRIQKDEASRAKLAGWLRSRGYSEFDLPTAAGAEGAEPAGRPPHKSSRPAPQSVTGEEDPNTAKAAYQSSPYPTLPSARDLYAKIPAEDTSPKRFGMEIFRNGTGNADTIPIDLPAGPDYVLGTGDGLNIDIWGGVSQRIARTVDREGRVALPEAGTIVVAGMTLAEAESLIQKTLAPQIRNVQVDVSLTRVRAVRVYVVGDVDKPGAYDVSSLSTPMNALYAAGGPTTRGSLRNVQHYRGGKLIRRIDFYEFLLRGIRSDEDRLLPGDTILVPPVGAQITVSGMVRRPAIYEIRSEQDLFELLDLAGGVLVSATLQQVRVERIEAHERRTTLNLNLAAKSDHAAVEAALHSFQVQDGDHVTIGSILPYSDKTVYLEGHVVRPGKYSYREGMMVSDVIRSWDELLPEPASKAELIRLVPPDFHPEAQQFELADVLTGDDPLGLQPFDTIRVIGRYESDAPKVAIYGQVLRPGEYPLSHNMTAAGLVRMAGGLKRNAYAQVADLATYVVQDGRQVQTEHREIDIGKALAGDSQSDVILQPQDVVTIRQLPGWSDVGASVTVSGEVNYPGTYGIREGERLSSFLQRAGGFRSTAYPEGAVLERVQVKELAEKSRAQLIQQIQTAALTMKTAATNAEEQTAAMQAMAQQRDQVLNELRSRPVTGRLVVNLSSDIQKWQNSSDDIQLRAGDVINIPKQPDFVLINGQVYNPSAITYRPGRNASWYLQGAGGLTQLANRKAIFIVRANGSVVAGGTGPWGSDALKLRMRPGDTIVVPEKIQTGSNIWKNLLNTAQFASSLALAGAVVAAL